MVRHGFYRLRGMCSIVYDTTIYDRNTVDLKRVIYGPFTIVIITITVGYVNVNDRILSFTIVVSIDLGKDPTTNPIGSDCRIESPGTLLLEIDN